MSSCGERTLARKQRNDLADADTSSWETAEGPVHPHPAVEQGKIWELLLSSTCRPLPSIFYSWFFKACSISFVASSYMKVLVWGLQISCLIHEAIFCITGNIQAQMKAEFSQQQGKEQTTYGSHSFVLCTATVTLVHLNLNCKVC